MNISPQYTLESFPRPWTLDTKIEIFRDRIFGWQLDIANQMINGPHENHALTSELAEWIYSGKMGIPDYTGELHFPEGFAIKGIEHSGFAALHVVFSYFETIAKYQAGYTGEKDSEVHFKKGVLSVFPDLAKSDDPNKYIGWLYKHGRNALYHGSTTGHRIILTNEFSGDLGLGNNALVIRPQHFVWALIVHFKGYIGQVSIPVNHVLRDNFEKRFDTDLKD